MTQETKAVLQFAGVIIFACVVGRLSWQANYVMRKNATRDAIIEAEAIKAITTKPAEQ